MVLRLPLFGLTLAVAGGALPDTLQLAALAHAHPGGLTTDGCHFDRKAGTRHCHGGGREPARREQFKATARGGRVTYANCAAARAAGAAPVLRGEPGYAPHLDRDNDGVGCE